MHVKHIKMKNLKSLDSESTRALAWHHGPCGSMKGWVWLQACNWGLTPGSVLWLDGSRWVEMRDINPESIWKSSAVPWVKKMKDKEWISVKSTYTANTYTHTVDPGNNTYCFFLIYTQTHNNQTSFSSVPDLIESPAKHLSRIKSMASS